MRHLKSAINFVADALETIAFVGSMYVVVYLFLFFPSSVQGASMEPTLHTGNRIVVSRVAYKMGEIQRGDIVVVISPKNPDVEYVKRAIGLPGDKILFSDGKVYINDDLLEEPYINTQTNTWDGFYAKENVPIMIPDDMIFVMGDNRPRSSDSREFGPVPLTSIVGKATILYYPQFKIGL